MKRIEIEQYKTGPKKGQFRLFSHVGLDITVPTIKQVVVVLEENFDKKKEKE